MTDCRLCMNISQAFARSKLTQLSSSSRYDGMIVEENSGFTKERNESDSVLQFLQSQSPLFIKCKWIFGDWTRLLYEIKKLCHS